MEQQRDLGGYPFGPLYQLLLLTGARKNEVAGARWSEFDLKKKIWTVPPERFKSNSSHLVPLSDAAIAIIKSPPRFTKGDHLFSTTYGEKPVGGFSKAKERLDKLMNAAPWVVHDVRRTVRTRNGAQATAQANYNYNIKEKEGGSDEPRPETGSSSPESQTESPFAESQKAFKEKRQPESPSRLDKMWLTVWPPF